MASQALASACSFLTFRSTSCGFRNHCPTRFIPCTLRRLCRRKSRSLRKNGYLEANDWFTVNAPKLPPGYVLDPPNVRGPWDHYRLDGLTRGEGWAVHEGNIKAIFFDDKQEVVAIEHEDGFRVSKTETPAFSAYLLPFSFPIFGFLLPWGLMKVFVWVGSGFTQKSI